MSIKEIELQIHAYIDACNFIHGDYMEITWRLHGNYNE